MAQETESPSPATPEVSAGAEKAAPVKKTGFGKLLLKAAQLLLIALILQTLAGLMPAIIEVVYSQLIYYYIARGLSFLNRFVSFSLGEVLLAGLALWFLGWAIWHIRRAVRGDARHLDVIKLLFLRLTWVFGLVYLIFLVLWGMNFQRLPIAETWDLEVRPTNSGELQAIGARIVEGINQNYKAASEGQDWSRASTLPLTRQRLNQVIEDSFQKTDPLQEASQGGLGPPKPFYFSRLMSNLGFSGIYLPFTAEPAINELIPPAELPFTIANQKAHQRGYAREDEANFIAFVICINADDPYVRYSGYLHGVRVLGEIENADAGRYRDMVAPGPSADLDASRQFWENGRNPDVRVLSSKVVQAYLRFNGVAGGIDSYNQDLPLIIGYYLKNFRRE
jgi:Protein of unknown function (DUF3810)